MLDEPVLGIARDDALPREVLRRREREVRGLAVVHPLAVVVEAREPVRHPTGARLEERDAQLRVTLERAVEHEARHRGHLLHRVRARVAQREAVEAVACRSSARCKPRPSCTASTRPVSSSASYSGSYARSPRLRPYRWLGRAIIADEPELGRAARLGRARPPDRASGAMPAAGQPALVGRAVPGDPVVVRAGTRRPTRPRRAPVGTGTNSPTDGYSTTASMPCASIARRYDGRVEPVLPLVGEVGAAARDERSRRRGGPSGCGRRSRGPEDAARFDDVRVGVEHAAAVARVRARQPRRAAMAPSSGITVPLMYAERSDARNATASHTSAAVPSRPIGLRLATMLDDRLGIGCLRRDLDEQPGVGRRGDTTLTRTASGACSIAACFARLTSAPFDAQYAA